ncbi:MULTISPECIES: thioesterase domain-containing protein [unclassified Kitasatospora]|uniref:thioesterase domain-containing protein n=1 Tax=unclassified Kitasatospora TaxID=2633591 RepID=UPI000710E8B8|nr:MULTISPECIES: thioesterase domain-containing protein [unclassified Kitasatospora]KQV19128.1 thioesterase [Kitasatospora sp. Root107]KRB75619.1 thioesterase [Kitasatospora sp. Root187]
MPPRRPGPVAALPLRRAAVGGHTVHLVHPGALAPQVHRTLAEALPEGVGLTVLDLSAVPEYGEAALTGGRAETTVEALADWAAGLTSHQFSLVGWSFGGVVAQAMVERLPADRRPERLVLLDSIAPTEEYQQPDEALEPPLLLGWFAMYLGAKRGRPVPLDPAALLGCGVDDGLPLVLDAATASGALLPDTPLPGLRKLYDTYVDGLLRNNRLTAPYRPKSSSVPLVLVKAERSLIPEDPTLGWQPLAPHGLSLAVAPGDHYTMLTRPDAAQAIARLVHPV